MTTATRAFFLVALFGLRWLGGSNQSLDQTETTPKPGSLSLVCSTDRPRVEPGEKVHLKVWKKAEAPSYVWSSTGGSIEGQGAEVTWTFDESASGIYTAKVVMRGSDSSPGECSVEVVVASDVRGTHRETGRSFLIKGEQEKDGYGLYSYLLFGSPPTSQSRDRYLKAIEAHLELIPDVTKLEGYFDRKQLNVTYLPLEVRPESDVSASWILERYDYARARSILDSLGGEHRNGPYIVSFLRSPGKPVDATARYLYQDLGSVPPDLVEHWEKEFLNQAAQEHFWEPKTGELMVLKLRTTIGILAMALPDVQKGLESWITWTHKS
jgi:hypothetical protein